MKTACHIAGAFVGLIVISGCSSQSKPRPTLAAGLPTPRPPRPPSQLPSLESRLAPEWISAATRIQRGKSVIYYHGTAEQNSAEGEIWTGTVKGDILFLSPEHAVLIPSGTLTLAPGNRVKVTGSSHSVLAPSAEAAKWRKLLTS